MKCGSASEVDLRYVRKKKKRKEQKELKGAGRWGVPKERKEASGGNKELIKDQRPKSSEIEDPADGDARGVWCSVADEMTNGEEWATKADAKGGEEAGGDDGNDGVGRVGLGKPMW